MARGLNKVLLIGNLGRDPEMKYTPQGTPVTTFSLAVSRTWKTPDGQTRDETEWFKVVAWERLAEQCNEYLRKGSKVFIEGRLQTREWQAPDGQQRQMVEVVASNMLILDSRQQAAVGGPAPYGEERPAPARQSGGYPSGYSNNNYDDEADVDVDDIPF
jgi:single-strand DNA-binding protein